MTDGSGGLAIPISASSLSSSSSSSSPSFSFQPKPVRLAVDPPRTQAKQATPMVEFRVIHEEQTLDIIKNI